MVKAAGSESSVANEQQLKIMGKVMKKILEVLGLPLYQSFEQGRQCILEALQSGQIEREQVDLAEDQAIEHVGKEL